MSQVCPLRTDHDSFNYSCSFSAQMCNNVSECILDVFLAGPQLADVYTNLSNRTESAQFWLEVAVLVNLAEQQSLNGTSTVPLLTSDGTGDAQTTKHTVFTSTEGNKLTNQQISVKWKAGSIHFSISNCKALHLCVATFFVPSCYPIRCFIDIHYVT